MKRIILFISCLMISTLLLFPVQANALNLMESIFLKITLVENGVEHEWEYTSPGKYEYEKGNQVTKSNEAKESMLAVIKTINLSDKAKVEEMVNLIKKEQFPKLERLDIRWMNGENELYTWLWEKDK